MDKRNRIQGKAGSIPAGWPTSGETGAGFESRVVDSGEPKGPRGPRVNATAESVAGVEDTNGEPRWRVIQKVAVYVIAITVLITILMNR